MRWRTANARRRKARRRTVVWYPDMQMLITTVRQSPRRPWRKVTVGGKVFVVGAGGHSVGVFL